MESRSPKDTTHTVDTYNQAVTALEIIYEAALEGSPGAGEVLRDMTARLADRAARWRNAVQRQ